jgi:hypothetical protein
MEEMKKNHINTKTKELDASNAQIYEKVAHPTNTLLTINPQERETLDIHKCNGEKSFNIFYGKIITNSMKHNPCEA